MNNQEFDPILSQRDSLIRGQVDNQNKKTVKELRNMFEKPQPFKNQQNTGYKSPQQINNKLIKQDEIQNQNMLLIPKNPNTNIQDSQQLNRQMLQTSLYAIKKNNKDLQNPLQTENNTEQNNLIQSVLNTNVDKTLDQKLKVAVIIIQKIWRGARQR